MTYLRAPQRLMYLSYDIILTQTVFFIPILQCIYIVQGKRVGLVRVDYSSDTARVAFPYLNVI